MTRCESDWSVHSRVDDNGKMITTTSVDDILVASDSKQKSDRFTEEMQSRYAVTDNGDATWLLGCKITRWRQRCCLKLDQERYVTTILEQFSMANCKAVSVPMVARLSKSDCETMPSDLAETKELPY